jgi:hypothetical protein
MRVSWMSTSTSKLVQLMLRNRSSSQIKRRLIKKRIRAKYCP